MNKIRFTKEIKILRYSWITKTESRGSERGSNDLSVRRQEEITKCSMIKDRKN